MEKLAQKPSLTLTRRYAAAPEKVWRAWTDPEAIKRWFGPGPGDPVSIAEVGLRVGGRFRIVMQGPDCDHEHTGEYLVLDRPRRLVLTWTSAETHGRATTLSVELRSLGGERTELTLVHEGLPDDTAAGRHRSGWGDILEKLAAALSGGGSHA